MSRRNAIQTAQSQLNAEFGGLEADGVWGRQTERAFAASSPALRELVVEVAMNAGFSIDSLRGKKPASKMFTPTKPIANPVVRPFTPAQVGKSGATISSPTIRSTASGVSDFVHEYEAGQVDQGKGAFRKVVNDVNTKRVADSDGASRWVTESQMRLIISRVSGETGIETTVLHDFLNLEAAQRRVNGGLQYDTMAVNRFGYSGLYQFDSKGDAWSDASRHVKGLSRWSVAAWSDPYQSTLAAAGYIKFNSIVIRRKGYKGPITGNTAYLMHNQGAGGANAILSGKTMLAGPQSQRANVVAQAAIRDAQLLV